MCNWALCAGSVQISQGNFARRSNVVCVVNNQSWLNNNQSIFKTLLEVALVLTFYTWSSFWDRHSSSNDRSFEVARLGVLLRPLSQCNWDSVHGALSNAGNWRGIRPDFEKVFCVRLED